MRALGDQRAHRLLEVGRKMPAERMKGNPERRISSCARPPSTDDTATGCDEAPGREVFTPPGLTPHISHLTSHAV